jgi:hypothetical protein
MPVFRVKAHTRDFPRGLFQTETAINVETKSGASIIWTSLLYIKIIPICLPDFNRVLQFFTGKGDGRLFLL